MRWRLVFMVGCALLALGGVAKATGVADSGPSVSTKEAAMAKVERLQAQIESRLAPDIAQSGRGRRGPKGRRGARGPQGAVGPKGATGPAGAKGTFGSITSVKGPSVILGPFGTGTSVGIAEAICPAGTTLIGGGWQGGTIETTVSYTAPGGPNTWAVIATNLSELFTANFNAVAMCATP